MVQGDVGYFLNDRHSGYLFYSYFRGPTMKKWSDIYKERLCDSYYQYFKVRYKDFLTEIDLKHYSFLELGCGIGNTTKFIDEHRKDYMTYRTGIVAKKLSLTCVDNDEEMLQLCAVNLRNIGTNLFNADITQKKFKLYPETVVHSHGVLEHLQDNQIHDVLEMYMSCPSQTHYVPTDKYTEPSRGDERLMPAEYWLDTFKPTSWKLFNNDFDLVLTWKK